MEDSAEGKRLAGGAINAANGSSAAGGVGPVGAEPGAPIDMSVGGAAGAAFSSLGSSPGKTHFFFSLS